MVAYAIIRNWEHRLFRYSFIYLLAGLFIPFTVVILPLIKQTSVLGLDNPAGVALIHIVGGIAFNTLLFCAFLRSIPTELEESARIDGASTWQVFWQVVFPLLGPMSATVGIFAFLNSWNDFILPQMLIANPSLQTLPVVQHIFQGEFNIEYNLAFASYLMALGPTLIAFIIAQRWVLSGVMRGAIK
nr:carbohydrate ABC transporter permease [Hoyosella altamirensis]